MDLISCKEAKQKGFSKYYTGKPCPKGHVCPRRVSNNSCCDCDNQLARQRAKLRTPEYRKERRDRKRLEIVDHLGGKCVRCGFSDIRALQIDHVNGGGVKARKQPNYNWWRFWVEVRKDTSGKYQLLCANCNWIKREENGELYK
jgi:hypothetical protein